MFYAGCRKPGEPNQANKDFLIQHFPTTGFHP